MRRFLVCQLTALAAAIAGLASPALAGEARFYLAPYGLQSTLDGEGRFTGGDSIPGTDFDFEDTLGLDPDITASGVEGWVKILGFRIAFSYQQADLDGDAVLEDDLTIDGETYSVSETLESEIEIRRARLMLGWDFSLKIVNVGFLVGVQAFQTELEFTSSTGARQTEDADAPVPAVGITVGIHPIDSLAIHLDASGMQANVSGIDATLVDGYAGLDWLFLKKFGLTAGYRYFHLEAEHEDDDNRIDMTQRGPFAGIVLHL